MRPFSATAVDTDDCIRDIGGTEPAEIKPCVVKKSKPKELPKKNQKKGGRSKWEIRGGNNVCNY